MAERKTGPGWSQKALLPVLNERKQQIIINVVIIMLQQVINDHRMIMNEFCLVLQCHIAGLQ